MAIKTNWIERNNRNYLKDVLPLNTPYSIQIETIKACNFRCNYCAYSSLKIEPYIMQLDVFKNISNSLCKFPSKIKNFIFSGLGEPLINKDIFKMISLIKNTDHVENTTVLTNGSLLNENNIDNILNTYIDEIRISLQGITEEDYYKICGYKINFKEFVDNIEYLYKNRGNTKIALKIADIAIDTEDKQKKFFELFEDKADYLIIQKISPLQNIVNYTDIISDYSKGVYIENKTNCLVCPQPFYSMQILADGRVAPCCSLNLDSPTIGNINSKNIYDIWNDNKLRDLRIRMLKGNRNLIGGCKKCNYPEFQYNKYDYIDNYREELLKKYE
ncbi:radical SAM protein [uncultured Brachyspira sp.]|uniref:radical SAM/SPASM domain-containing protein n=1 Tax=uncultured Brachyspira sp. TaxID=221953 RepID=UPI002606C8A1|nr:radical SAM protein [uncultured Brachyspira sp.]